MFDCNLIKSREQKMRDILLPNLESSCQKLNLCDSGATPRPNLPDYSAPAAPASPDPPTAPSPADPPGLPTSPESELNFPTSPVLPKDQPAAPDLPVPANPLLPPDYSSVMDYEGLQYMNGYLRTQISKNVQVEFLVGSSHIEVKSGKLIGVGLNYILLENAETGDVSACDFYNIKFCRSFGDGSGDGAAANGSSRRRI
jgi:hypothetical protein